MKTVKVRNLVLGEGRTKICVPLTPADRKEMEEQLPVILASAPDLVEWRADYFRELLAPGVLEEELSHLRGCLMEIPLLFTFRTRAEGGEADVSLEEYGRLNVRAAASGQADLVDVEWNRGPEPVRCIMEAVRSKGALSLCSFHDFQKTPGKEELVRLLCAMQELGADVTKAAVMPQSERDVLTLLDATLAMKERYADRPFLTMSMGGLGSLTRLAGNLTGSAFTFAAAARSSAPGQMEVSFVREAVEKCR